MAVEINHDGDTLRLDGFEDWPALSYVGGPTTPPQVAAAARLTKHRVRLLAHRRLEVTYRLSRKAAVTFRIQRRAGRRFKMLRGSLKQRGKAGKNTFRISVKRLETGRYRLVARPRGGAAVRAKFAVAR